MELRHLRYFLAVAEEGNFTRAAARLGIGQPPLSLQIKALEAEIGTPLFHRVPHGAELTDAGRVFRDGVQSLPATVEQAARAALRAARGETGTLSLGFIGTAALNPAVPLLIRAFRHAYPDVDLRLDEGTSSVLLAAVRDGRLDIAIIRPNGSEPDDLRLHPLAEDPLLLALPAQHPQAGGDGPLDLGLLRHDLLIQTPREQGTGLYAASLAACQRAGFVPRFGPQAPQIVSILSMVAAELGFSIVPASARRLALPGVVFREIAGETQTVSFTLAHRRDDRSAVVRSFIAKSRHLQQRQEKNII